MSTMGITGAGPAEGNRELGQTQAGSPMQPEITPAPIIPPSNQETQPAPATSAPEQKAPVVFSPEQINQGLGAQKPPEKPYLNPTAPPTQPVAPTPSTPISTLRPAEPQITSRSPSQQTQLDPLVLSQKSQEGLRGGNPSEVAARTVEVLNRVKSGSV